MRGSSRERAEKCWGIWSDTLEGQRLEAVLGEGPLPMPNRGERDGIPKDEANWKQNGPVRSRGL